MIQPPFDATEYPVAPEIERLLNPAYCAWVLARFALAYRLSEHEQPANGAPFMLMFLCLPMVLHGRTRDVIVSHNQPYSIHRLVRDHPEITVNLAERVRGLAATTRAAMLFGTNHNILFLDSSSAMIQANDRTARRVKSEIIGTESMQPVRAADRLGAWLDGFTMAEVFMYLGLRP